MDDPERPDIAAAILDCLAECREAVDAQERERCVAVYLLTLRADAGWSEEEVRQVERGVRAGFAWRESA